MVDLIKLGDLEICLLSFNLGNYFKSLLTKYNNIKTDFVRLFKPGKNRIWVITTQEDKIDSQFMKNIQTYFNKKITGQTDENLDNYLRAYPVQYRNRVLLPQERCNQSF